MPEHRAWPKGLDEATQRKLILRAAAECAPDRAGDFRGRCYSFQELDTELREYAWMAGVLCWLVFPLFALIDVGLFMRIRSTVARNWEQWLALPDAESEMWVALAAVRRTIKALPRRVRSGTRGVNAELKRIEKHWGDLSRRLETVKQAITTIDGRTLHHSTAELTAQLAGEADPTTRATNERRLSTLQSQLQTFESLTTWKGRLEAAQAECLESLARMNSQLALMSAADTAARPLPLEHTTENLRQISDHLTATQQAAEEVLQLQVRG